MKTIGFTMLPVILLCVLTIGLCNGESYKCPRTKKPGDNCTTPSGEEGICERNGSGSYGLCAPLTCKVNEINGGFTDWSDWSDTCTDAPCLEETQTRTRTCTDPPPSNGGANCTGEMMESRYCPSPNHDCLDIRNSGMSESGVYTIALRESGQNIDVFCDMDKDGGGWTVFQNRYDGSVNFDNPIQDYKDGFGNVNGEYWLGLDNINLLTSCPSQLYIHLVNKNEVGYQIWNGFSVGNYDNNFILTTGNLTISTAGVTGDDIRQTDGAPFTASDHDYDTKDGANCAIEESGGWWFKRCSSVNLNGLYTTRFYYYSFSGYNLKASRMMVRRINF